MNKMHESNHTKWNAAAPRWKARRDSKGPWHRGHLVPERVEKALEYWRENALTEQGVEHIAQHLGSLFEILHVWEEPTKNHDRWRQNCFHALPNGFRMVCKKKE